MFLLSRYDVGDYVRLGTSHIQKGDHKRKGGECNSPLLRRGREEGGGRSRGRRERSSRERKKESRKKTEGEERREAAPLHPEHKKIV